MLNWPEIYLVSLAVGALWSLISLVLGGWHLPHVHGPHLHGPHMHLPHGAHSHAGHGTHAYPGFASAWLMSLVNPSCIAVFLAWFGGVGYLLSRHSGWSFWMNLAIAILLGLAGACLIAAFVRFLHARERPLDPQDYFLVGVVGSVSSSLSAGKTGEMIYLRDGARRALCARSEDGAAIERGEEVVVIRYEKGIAYVRTWEALTQAASQAASQAGSLTEPEKSPKEME
jgi:membrane protein implicated in regulation of membrane protease activity